MTREEELQSLLEESLEKIQYVLNTPPDVLWTGKVQDFMASTYNYLNSGTLTDCIYNHKILREKK